MRIPYKGKLIKTASPTGGKAGKGLNKTSTIQVFDPKETRLDKQIRYNVGDPKSLLKAIQKSKDWIDGKKIDERGGARPGAGIRKNKLEEGEATPLYLDKTTRDIFSDLGDGDRSKGARRAAKIASDLAENPFRDKTLRCSGCGELKIEELIYCTKCGTDLPKEEK